ncbi:hypothetical protein DICVIV_07906 [Dictyocaulus viviparus]|uniref:RRM domain-containing protein n=1 Tax=Dictyocaulus viviparus TaxID=29172 RepID=A0A0D8XN97_DICVI|nr:hypothetical protein DICVIV_07906 [Dictyocaulus viviparus]
MTLWRLGILLHLAMNNSYNRSERTLFVSMMHKSITDDDLYEILTQAGPIEKIIFKQNKDGTPSHALVIFRNVESVVFSMVHIFPVVRSAGLIQIRPLRESSHHYFRTGSGHYGVSQIKNDAFSNEFLNFSKDDNTVALWNNQPPQKNLNKACAISYSDTKKKLSPGVAGETCKEHDDSHSQSVISKLYPLPNSFSLEKLPVVCNSLPGHIGNLKISMQPSMHRFPPHRGSCSKICCAKT